MVRGPQNYSPAGCIWPTGRRLATPDLCNEYFTGPVTVMACAETGHKLSAQLQLRLQLILEFLPSYGYSRNWKLTLGPCMVTPNMCKLVSFGLWSVSYIHMVKVYANTYIVSCYFRTTSIINGREYVPFMTVDVRERFAYPVTFTWVTVI